MPPKTGMDLFDTHPKDRILANRHAELLSDYDKLYSILESNGYAGPIEFRPVNSEISLTHVP